MINSKRFTEIVIKKVKDHIVGILILLIIWIIGVRKALLVKGIIVHKDIRYPLSLKQFVELTAYTWTEKHDMPNVFVARYPLVLLVKALSNILSYIIVIKFYILLPSLLAGISMYLLAYTILREEFIKTTERFEKGYNLLASTIFSALMYMTNPYAILIWHNSTFMSIGYSVLPLVFYCLYRILTKQKFRYCIIYAILISLTSLQPHPLVLWVFPLTFITVSVYVILRRIHLKQIAKTMIVMMSFIIVVNAYWILPLIPHVFMYEHRTPLYSLSPSMLEFYSKNNTIINILNLEHHPWDDDRLPLELSSNIYVKVWFIIGIVLVIMSVYILCKINNLRKEAKIVVCIISLLYVLSIIWASGVRSSLGNIYGYLVLHFPLGWILRTPHKFDGLIAFTLSLLLAFSFSMVLNELWNLFYKKRIKIFATAILSFLTVLLILFHGWPIFTGNFNMRFSPKNPGPYINITELFDKHLNNDYFNVLWLPPGFWHLYFRDIGPLSISKNIFSTYPINQREYVNNILAELKKGELKKVAIKLSTIGVKYIVIDLNLTSEEQYKYWLHIAARFEVNYGFELGKKVGWYAPFEKRGEWAIQSSIVFDGKYAAKISSYSKGLYAIIQDVVFPILHSHGHPIVAEAVFYSLSTTNRCFIVINWYNENFKHIDTVISNDYCGNSTSRWIKAKIVVTPPSRAKFFRIGVAIEGNGTVYVDNVRILSPYLNLFKAVYLSDRLIIIQNMEPARLIYVTNTTLATISTIDKLSPVHFVVKIYAVKPFMLVLAEGYDPLWEARVYKDGKLVEKVRAIPVYGVINGFWINETGNLTIIIRYVPQDWFELGLRISSITFALCVLYLFYDWRKSKSDWWALWLGHKVRQLVRFLGGVV